MSHHDEGRTQVHITFIHTPMAAVSVPERLAFWQNFDKQYCGTHPRMPNMKRVMWELPHWMHWLGGVLVSRGYTSMDVVDLYTEPGMIGVASRIDQEAVHRTLRDYPATDVWLFSPMTVNLPLALQIADVIKQLYPRSKVIFGGVVATPLHNEIAQHRSVDFVVWGRGEVALPALLDAIAGQSPLTDVRNLTQVTPDGEIWTSPLSYPDMAVTEIPFPKVDLFPESAGEEIRYLRQVYGLGCPFKCSFCTIQTIGQKANYFAIDRVLAEIRAYRDRYGQHHNIYWGDETFTLHSERTLALLSALEAEGGIYYDCQTRLNCLQDVKVLRALRSSGCRWVEIGLETGVQDTHDVHKHHLNLSLVEGTLKMLRDEGLAACAFTVNGFPDQDVDDMRRSIDWVCDLIERDLLQASYLFGLVPYPGSALYGSPEKYGMKLLHRDYGLYHEDMPPVYETASATSDQIYQVFIDGVQWLGQAMAKRPYFGSEDEVGDYVYGKFWEGAHV